MFSNGAQFMLFYSSLGAIHKLQLHQRGGVIESQLYLRTSDQRKLHICDMEYFFDWMWWNLLNLNVKSIWIFGAILAIRGLFVKPIQRYGI